MEPHRPTVAVHVVWHPSCAAGLQLAHSLFVNLFEDPDDLAAHGLRIPVRLWRPREPREDWLPPLRDSGRSVVVVLIDDAFVGARWDPMLDRVHDAAGAGDVVLGVTLTDLALDMSSQLPERNFVRLHAVEPELHEQVLVNRVTHTLCRLLAPTDDPVLVFVSHAKRDGVEIAEAVRSFLHSGTGVKDFFDAQDLLEGVRWADVIRGAAAHNVLLAIRTDAYATREWCRTEVLEAKRAGSPVIVLDALESLESRGFPYLGNAPSVRWRGDLSRVAMEHVLGVVLHETLRFRHFPARVSDLLAAHGIPATGSVLPVPPELLTALRVRAQAAHAGTRVVYPDPPLGTDELSLVCELAPELEPITPTGLLARR